MALSRAVLAAAALMLLSAGPASGTAPWAGQRGQRAARALGVRGGETARDLAVEAVAAAENAAVERAWVFGQIKALQLKLAYLSDALQRDGVNATCFDCREPVTRKEPEPVVWQESLKKDGDGKRCLLYGDTEDGAVMVAPKGSDKWVTLHELNRVRRDGADGARQVSDLWYGQYAMRYEQLMGRMPLKGVAAAMVLNHPHGVKFLLAGAAGVGLTAFYKPIEAITLRILTSGFVWKRYHIWSQFLYWPLPMKLIVYRQIAVYLWKVLTNVEKQIHTALVDAECDLLEEVHRQAVEDAEGWDDADDDTGGDEGFDE
uniref:Uncharacterized protein n=2 Tax=Phaeomonas parva TaxID=124430 RepID=A0A7S1XQ97_9STRA|mmetsp:Transcript_24911/g.77979  ORF Transcript_24911/g.77979 Transcript_24911/m.77979 type:complete len:316 (+) Transcript_24911:144-1091(+)